MARLRFVTAVAVMVLACAPAAAAPAWASSAWRVVQLEPIKDEELKSFAAVVLEVQRINTAYLPTFEAAGTAEERQKVAETAEGEVRQFIAKQGMSMERFHEILNRTRTNPGLADQVRAYMKEAQ